MASIKPPDKDSEAIRSNNQAMEDYMASFFMGVEEALPVEVSPIQATPTVLVEAVMQELGEQLPRLSPESPMSLESPMSKGAAKFASLTPPKLLAEQVPSDVLLNPLQKKGLQRLLDATINHAVIDTAPVLPLTLPETPVADVAKPEMLEFTEVLDLTVPENTAALANAAAAVERVEPEKIVVLTAALAPNHASSGSKNTASKLATRASLANPESLRPSAKAPVIILPEEYRAHWQGQLPAWGHKRFDVLLFSCRGVTLAIPLISLGHIYLHNQPLNILPHLPHWVLGVKPVADGKLKVADAGAYFLPERSATLNIDAEIHIIGLADSDWAFAVDSVANPTKIDANDVQWRPFSKTSPWLAGAIKRQMCVLIDTPALIKQLGGQRL